MKAEVVEMNPAEAIAANLARLSYNASLRARAALRRAAARLSVGQVIESQKRAWQWAGGSQFAFTVPILPCNYLNFWDKFAKDSCYISNCITVLTELESYVATGKTSKRKETEKRSRLLFIGVKYLSEQSTLVGMTVRISSRFVITTLFRHQSCFG